MYDEATGKRKRVSTDYQEYFRQLYERAETALKVPFREISFEGWQPALNKCHDNVDHWVRHHPESRAVRGWAFWPNAPGERCRFMAHSVVEENGALFDITPIAKNTPREGLVFLTHSGIEEEFESMKISCSEVLYPPITMDQWREYQCSAEHEEETDA